MGKKQKDPNRLGVGTILVWAMPGMSLAAEMMMIGQISLFCTSILGMPVALIGTLMVASKVLDCFTDFVIGYIVDNTNSKWGRGRPYDFCMLGSWFVVVLIFACPQSFSLAGKCAWIIVLYTIASSGFNSLYGAAVGPYMVRAFDNNEKYVKLNSYGGMISLLGAVAVNMILPQLLEANGDTAQGWVRIALTMAIPLTGIALIRFFVIKEKYSVDAKSEHLAVKDILAVLKTNKYIYPIAVMLMMTSIVANFGIGTYYYTYVVKNLGMASFAGLMQIVALPVMFFIPFLAKKFNLTKVMCMGFVLCGIGSIVNWFAYDNVGLLLFGALLTSIGAFPTSMLPGVMILQCADYNEWKGMPRMEATMSALPGLTGNIGTALGTFVATAFLALGGFVSSSDGLYYDQPESAILMLRVLMSFVPLALYAIAFVAIRFYTLEKQLPQIDADIAERRKERAQNA